MAKLDPPSSERGEEREWMRKSTSSQSENVRISFVSEMVLALKSNTEGKSQ